MNELAPTDEQLAAAVAAYQHWSGVATLLRSPHRPDMSETDIGLIGFPTSAGNSIERMQYLGPRAVRNRSSSYRRMHREWQVDAFALARVSDLGDVPVLSHLQPDELVHEAEAFYRRVDAHGITPVTIGGDHSVTTPVLRAIAGPKSKRGGPIGMIHLDCHSDTQGPMGGAKHHAGAAFRLGVEEGLIDPARTVQIGFHGPMAMLSQDFFSYENFRVIPLKEMLAHNMEWVAAEVRKVVGDGPTYFSLDLDVLDPAYAPGVADPEVGGLTTLQLFDFMNGLRGINIVGADIVCFCPPLDNPGQITALAASAALLQLVTHIADYRASAKG